MHHAKQTLSYLTEAYAPILKNRLTPEEVFVVGVFTQVHDVGMKPHGGYTPAQIYSHHTDKASEFVDKYLSNIPFKKEIQALCLVHNKSLAQARTHFDGLENEEMRFSWSVQQAFQSVASGKLYSEILGERHYDFCHD
ncbi:MAG: hypothetical protein HXY43_15755 [Fischerella sp.]|nr:hypothetical protein [Fischerella sp.]